MSARPALDSDDVAARRALFWLRPDVIFLNHGSFGACPRAVMEVYQQWQIELERQPVEFLSLERRFPALMAEARRALGAYVGADPDDVVFVPNATTGLNVVARSLPLQPGDEVLGTDHEYGALERTWRFVCERRGARYVAQPVPVPLRRAEEVVEAIWSGVTARTRVLFLSHLTSPTAILFPIEALVRRARAAGIWTVVDGAHAPGQVPLDLAALGVDFYSGNLHKWACSPKGSALLYARRAVQPLLAPLVVSWGWQSDAPGPSRFVDEQEYLGTNDPAAYLAVPAAIEWLARHRWDEVRAACHALLRYTRHAISALTGLEPLTPDSPDWYRQMAALPLPPCDPARLKRRLYDEFRIEVPIVTWQGRPFIRVSIQGYNSVADVDALVAALAASL